MDFGLVSFIGLFLGSHLIAYTMGDMQLSWPIRMVGLAFLLIPTISYWRELLKRGRNDSCCGLFFNH